EADRTFPGGLRRGLLRRLILPAPHAGSSRMWTPCGTCVRSRSAPDLDRGRESRTPAPAPAPLEELRRPFEDESPRISIFPLCNRAPENGGGPPGLRDDRPAARNGPRMEEKPSAAR